MNKPILTQAKLLAVGRYLLLQVLFMVLVINQSIAQYCGTPSPLLGVPSVACQNDLDTFRISPFVVGYSYQLLVSPPGSVGINFISTPQGPGYEVNWGNTIGNYKLYFQVISPFFCSDTFNVHLSGRAAPQMNCNDTVNISLDENCRGFVYPSLILEGVFDSLDYIIVIKDPKTNLPIPTSPYVGVAHLGKYLIVESHHICSGNTCWGMLLVEDKQPPRLACRSYQINCDQAYTPEIIGFPNPPGAINPTLISPRKYRSTSSFYDNCGPTNLSYTDRIVHVDCPPPVPYIDTVFRDWVAIDSYGNIATCSDTILIRIGDIGAVICPPNFDNIQNPALACNGIYKKDAAGNPHPDTTGYPTFVKCRNLDYTYSDIKLKACEGTYKILREWIIADWCTGRQTTCIQIIKVIDDRITLFCSPNITISTLAATCEGEANIPTPTVLNECSSVKWEVKVKRGADPLLSPSAIDATSAGVFRVNDSLYNIRNLPVGLSWVLFIGTDGCGNLDTCATEVTVEEKTKPIAVCDFETVVTLTDDGSAKVYALTFDDGSHDNCGLGSFQVRRMDPGNCPDPIKDDNLFGDYVEFCCNDIPNNPVLVVLQVKDRAGNTNECMVWVTIQDKKPPVVVCLPDITVSCEFDRSNLSVFGTYRRTEAERKNIFLYDPTNKSFSQPHIWGRDGLVTEDCNLTKDSSVSFNLNHCGLGTIERRFTFRDDFNNPYTCTQIITVQDFTKFDGDVSIDWPEPIEVDGCHSDISTNITGKPSWPTNLTCSNILATYDDQVFSIVENVCFKVLRKWTVVDWCIYNSSTGAGRWTYVQVIKIRNSIAPTITSSCADISFEGISTDCNGFATLTATATDDCLPAQLIYNYQIDLFDNTSIDYSGVGNNASGTYPVGPHRIKWTVTDQCGNFASCNYLFTILDRKKPSPFCRVGIITVIMPSNGQVTIWASDLNSHSSDNCTPSERLRYSFSSDPADASRTYTCAQIRNGVSESFDVTIYVTDEAGNYDFCDTKVIVQDGIGNACLDNIVGGGTGNLAGNIFNESNNKVENAMVTLNGNMPSMPKHEMTRPDGQYSFIQLPLNETYVLSAHKEDEPLNGVTTQDIVLIQKHILGLQTLNSPYKMIAADVNNSQSITAKDVSDLRRLILGITNNFVDNKSWKFVCSDQIFSDINHPWPFNENSAINNLANDKLDNNFVAIKMGDVSGNAKTNNLNNISSRNNAQISLTIPNQLFQQNEIVRIPVSLNCEFSIYGMQTQFSFDPQIFSFVEFESGMMNIQDANYSMDGISSGKIKMSWDNSNGVSCDKPLFTIVLKSNKNGELNKSFVLSNENFKSEIYNNLSEAFDLSLTYYSANNEAMSGFYLFQNQPNPFSNTTSISFQLPRDGMVSLKVSDVNGKELIQIKRLFKMGFNSIEIDKKDINRSGVLYYHLEMDDHRAIRKMLILE
ncbi:MAG: hypothetical protein IPO16_04640 [Saprospiraceae bacterium]|nr:hypothetical protein [Saprospiraceae bacterium]